MKKRIYIHTNERQWLGAVVSAHSYRRNSRHADAFDIEFLRTDDWEFLRKKDGQPYLRGGVERVWAMDDLQSFTPLRFLPPRLMAYEGRAIVTDPDVFAVGDIHDLFTPDMGGAVVMGRRRSENPEKSDVATSVMLLECAGLRHWDPEREFDELFRFERDYKDWISLRHEPAAHVGYLEPCWNDFDRLTPQTRLLHNTRRRTQPWKTGLPVDYTPADKFKRRPTLAALNRARVRLFGRFAFLGRYRAHPDRAQEQLFFSLLRECLEEGSVTEDLVRQEMARDHVRHDAFELLDRVEAPRGLEPR